ncbi:type II toxin-antitoxin system RelE family toxin [Natranaerobius trueperi]|uniref:Addiction module toxin RelE n=1 Tax=Natranaerobius trueperi TaxID=759412 RepID=A0A226BUM9_9FIRM|nr:type II toxin-antitoxin system RelE/ParE family toxin [Natranaerobius trueperi]OWZ82683.1 hypothetical protein CDO51_12710 [Natranaerobius trueperi]
MSKGFQIHTTRTVEKDLDKLHSKHFEQVKEEVLKLEEDPYIGAPLKGKLKGCRSINLSLYGLGEYRVIYTLKIAEKVCLIFFIGSRENAYEEATRKVETLKKQGLI